MNKKTIWILIAILFIFSAVIIHQRINVEKKYNNVELILDYDEILRKCALTGADFNETLLKFKDSGITTIAFNEETVEVLQNYGKVLSTNEACAACEENTEGLKPGLSFLVAKDKAYIIDKIKKYLPDVKKSFNKLLNGDYNLQLGASYVDMSTYGLGFDSGAVDKVKKLGFNIILRPKNKPNLTKDLLGKYWQEIKEISQLSGNSFSGVIFGGLENEVLGYPSMLSVTSGEMGDMNGLMGVVEAGQQDKEQKGIVFLASKGPQKVARVMSISDLYLAKLKPDSVVEKFTLGVFERNIRWAYIHLFNASYDGASVMDTNLKMVADLKSNLKNNFNFVKVDNKLTGYSGFVYFGFIIFAGFMFLILAIFLMDDFIKISAALKTFLIILFILMASFLIFKNQFLYIRLMALGNAVLFVILAFKIGIEYLNKNLKNKKSKDRSRSAITELMQILAAFFIIAFISFTGGLTIAALLFKEEFLLNIYQFMGVKLLMILPPVIVFYWYMVTQGKKSSKEIFGWPVTWGQAVLLLVLMAAGVYYIMRTGNMGEGTALEAEKTFRSYLSNMLVVRPRLKEILFAHPALILALAFIKDKKNYVLCALFLLFGAIGQADIVDTFAHAHTPVVISLIRFGYGLLFGAVIGIIYYLVYKLLWKEKS